MSHPRILTIIIIMCSLLIISLSSATNVVDFCVADLKYPVGLTGYPCKELSNVTVDDFVYSGLNVPGHVSKEFKAQWSAAFDLTFPGLNGLGLSMVRANLDVGGSVPIHSHRVSEIMFVVEGTVKAGLIGFDSQAYYKTLKKGDVMVFPATLYHYVVNEGKRPAFLLAAWNGANPGSRILSADIATNDLSSEIIHKTTLLDVKQIKKLKKIFGGSN